MNKSYLSYKELLKAKDVMDMLAWQQDEAFGSLRNFIIEAQKFIEENPTPEEDAKLMKIFEATETRKHTTLVQVRGMWYEALAALPEKREVILKQRVEGMEDNPSAAHVYIHEITDIIVSEH